MKNKNRNITVCCSKCGAQSAVKQILLQALQLHLEQNLNKTKQLRHFYDHISDYYDRQYANWTKKIIYPCYNYAATVPHTIYDLQNMSNKNYTSRYNQ